MQVIILCGGKGMRMGSELEGLPKVLAPIGNRPILWHILKYFSHYGFNDFILSLGYKGEMIRGYFGKKYGFNINFIDTGLETNTGGRIKKCNKLIKSENFFVTYGDGLSNINLRTLLDFHLRNEKMATLTAVKPRSAFGILNISKGNVVKKFDEKPVLEHWINGGFFIFNKTCLEHIKSNDVLETNTFSLLTKKKELVAFKHYGFWECMDTYKDNLKLNEFWSKNKAPWKIWED